MFLIFFRCSSGQTYYVMMTFSTNKLYNMCIFSCVKWRAYTGQFVVGMSLTNTSKPLV
jgi:hypothetical protein